MNPSNQELMKASMEETSDVTSDVNKQELLKQFEGVRRITKICLILTWVVIVCYECNQGVTWMSGLKAILFLIITWQLWWIEPQK